MPGLFRCDTHLLHDALALCFQQASLLSTPRRRGTQLKLYITDIRIAISQCDESIHIGRVEFVPKRLQRWKIVPRANADGLVVGGRFVKILHHAINSLSLLPYAFRRIVQHDH